jgi:hypothetical protein
MGRPEEACWRTTALVLRSGGVTAHVGETDGGRHANGDLAVVQEDRQIVHRRLALLSKACGRQRPDLWALVTPETLELWAPLGGLAPQLKNGFHTNVRGVRMLYDLAQTFGIVDLRQGIRDRLSERILLPRVGEHAAQGRCRGAGAWPESRELLNAAQAGLVGLGAARDDGCERLHALPLLAAAPNQEAQRGERDAVSRVSSIHASTSC